MAKKNTSREFKGFGVDSKTKKEAIFAYSPDWEAGGSSVELYEEEFDDELEQNGEDEESGNWGYLADGSLSDCLEAIMPLLTIELEMEDEMENISDDMDIENFFKGKTKKRAQRLEEIKKACLTNGKYEGRGWQIRSQRTRKECLWLAENGYPVVVN
jgi:hypothetical protein